MNRLWVRLSLAFALVILVVSIVGGAATYLAIEADMGRSSQVPPEVEAYFEQYRRDRMFAPLPALALVGLVAIAAGVWMSRTLSKPMKELGDAAQDIGRQDLSRRVHVEGTDEVQVLAARFNEMAHQLEEAEYLRSNLLADVAHELRNPLHVLRGNLQAMLDDVYPLNKREIARLVDQTHHLTALVDDLHELAQAEAHQLPLYMEATDIAALLKETTAIFEPMARAKGVSVRVELLGTMPVLAVDPDRMQQVLSNLLANALRFTPKGGAITVTAEQQAGAFCICVRDTGVGIAVEDLPRVFDRFYQADPARNRETASSGLGLAIAKAIVVEHGGRIVAESAGAGQGSRFTIELPLKG